MARRRVAYDFNDKIFGAGRSRISEVHATASNASILFPLAARDSFFSLSLSLFFFNVRSALHAGEEWLMRHGVVWKKKASTLLFGRDFLFPRDSCFSLASSLFFPLPAPSTFFPLRSLFFPFLFHRIFALSTYVAGLILGVRVNSLHGIKVHSWRWCPAAKLPGCKVKKKKKERKKNHEKNACIW